MDTPLDLDGLHMVNLALGQSRILGMIATGAALRETLDALLVFLEQDVPEMACSILLLDSDGVHLHPCSAPSLPEAYSKAIDGSAIGPCAGSCGTAAWRRERVVVSDIQTDPLWTDYRKLAAPYGLRACWSTPIFDADGRVLGTFAMYFRTPGDPEPRHQRLIDVALHVAAIAITCEQREGDRRRAITALRESEERYRLINLATKDAVWDWDLRSNTLWWNNGVESLFGYPLAEVPASLDWWVKRMHPEDRDRAHRSLQATAAGEDNSWSEDYRFQRCDGSYADVQDRGYVMRDASGTAVRMIGMMQDISGRKRAEARIRELAYYDPLTGLPNRVALQVQLAGTVVAGQPLALLFLDLNHFGEVNNTLGRHNGDILLLHVTDILRGIVGPAGQVAALGGDEFAILLAPLVDEGEVRALLDRIQLVLQKPVQLAGIPVSIEATLGVVLYPQHGATVEQLWQRADIALRAAKERHESHLFYSIECDHYDPVRLSLLGELREAIDAGQILLHYQPKVNLRTNRVCGLEALVRWQHPERGLLYPDAFLPLAEGTGLIHPLTACIVRMALREGLELVREGLVIEMSINLSARNLHDPAFCRSILEQVRAANFPATRLTLEVTETAIMDDPARAKAVLAELHEAGIHLAMDDFGIGHSSLAYLKDLPIDKLKIDKSFVMDFAQPRNAAIVRSAIELARNLGLEVTAEGVEDERTSLALRDMGCDLGQGYFFSRPLALKPLVAWLRESPLGLRLGGDGSPLQRDLRV
jgi:diguanylate cyclase (GGDEF)-like protein/PAS domain S-box-containing protein